MAGRGATEFARIVVPAYRGRTRRRARRAPVPDARVLSAKLGLNAPAWQAVRGVQLGSLGYALVGAYLFAWLAAWRLLGLEERWSN